MFYQPIIRRTLGGVFLLLFIFSSVPRIVWHDALSNHKDKIAYSASGSHFFKDDGKGISCKCDTVLVQSVFVAASSHFELGLFSFRIHTSPLGYDQVAFSEKPYFSLRGPPGFPVV